MPVLTQRVGQNMAGHPIGILLLETHAVLLPGNVANATTFNFPVLYKVVPGVEADRLIVRADESLLEPLIEAGRELVREGVRAISSGCGYFGYFQRQMAEALEVPVFMSSLLQVPLIARSLLPKQSVGIICANGKYMRERTLRSCGVDESVPLVIAGLEDQPTFFTNFLLNQGKADIEVMAQEVVGVAGRMVEQHPEVGAILLECSDLPPYAAEIQAVTGRPVFDFVTMINWMYSAVVRRPYTGYM
ncbi:MAG: aspartate/glutamate racemase family protein [Chloroflexi bacterium]|nr:aspartate/glutamate racemase family protein [Chloroflexota bacterium]